MRKKGNTLIGCIAALMIIVSTIGIYSSMVSNYYNSMKNRILKKSYVNLLEIVEKEIKYNMTFCDTLKLGNKSLWVDYESLLIKKIEECMENYEGNKVEVKVEIEEIKFDLIEFEITVKGIERHFEKYRYMEEP